MACLYVLRMMAAMHLGELFYLVLAIVAFVGFAGSLAAVSEIEAKQRASGGSRE